MVARVTRAALGVRRLAGHEVAGFVTSILVAPFILLGSGTDWAGKRQAARDVTSRATQVRGPSGNRGLEVES
jgi:hypothetical protein